MEPMPGEEPTLKDASNISASSNRPLHKHGDKAKMIVRRREKGMIVEGLDQPDQEPRQSRLLLDHKLTIEDKVEVNLIDPLNVEASDSSNKGKGSGPAGRDKQPEPKLLACSFCEREFSTPHALGGHQNAHKPERAMAKRQQELAMLETLRHLPHPPFCHFSASHSDPFVHGSAFNRPSALGVRMNPMKHTSPSLPWSSSPPNHWFGDRWPSVGSLAMMNPPSSNGRLRMMERPNPPRHDGATLGSTRLSGPVLVANRVPNDEEMNLWPRLESSEVNDELDLDLKL